MQKEFKKMLGHFLPSESNAYRPHLLRKPWLLFFITVVLTAEAFFAAGLMGSESARRYLSAVLPGEVIALTNDERTLAGDGILTESPALTLAAQNKAKDMAAKGYFSHVGPGGKSPWIWITEAGYSYQSAGENLAVRFDSSSDVVHAWMASPTHRANIVKPVYTEIGVGTAEGMYEGVPATFVVQYFGSPQKVEVATEPAPAEEEESPRPLPGGGAEVAGASTEEAPKTPAIAEVPAENIPVTAPSMTVRPDQPTRQAVQVFLRANEASSNTIAWIIGGVATLLMLLLALAFFVHIEIQPGDMLAGGAFVGVVAVSLLMLNASVSSGAKPQGQQAGAAAFAVSGGVITDPGGIFIEGDSTVAPVPGR